METTRRGFAFHRVNLGGRIYIHVYGSCRRNRSGGERYAALVIDRVRGAGAKMRARRQNRRQHFGKRLLPDVGKNRQSRRGRNSSLLASAGKLAIDQPSI